MNIVTSRRGDLEARNQPFARMSQSAPWYPCLCRVSRVPRGVTLQLDPNGDWRSRYFWVGRKIKSKASLLIWTRRTRWQPPQGLKCLKMGLPTNRKVLWEAGQE